MENKIGALWLKKSAKGSTFMSGKVAIDGKTVKVVVFKNDKGDNENRPDYQIFESKDKEQKQEEIDISEIPF